MTPLSLVFRGRFHSVVHLIEKSPTILKRFYSVRVLVNQFLYDNLQQSIFYLLGNHAPSYQISQPSVRHENPCDSIYKIPVFLVYFKHLGFVFCHFHVKHDCIVKSSINKTFGGFF